MASLPTAQTSTATSRYPKRKRTQVDYHESEIDLGSSELDAGESQDYSPSKKRKAAAPKSLPKRKIFPFMDLPAEIRNIIYGYCLIDPSGIFLSSTTKQFRRTVRRVPEQDFRGVRPTWAIYRSDSSYDSTNETDSFVAGDSDEEPKKEKAKEYVPSSRVSPLIPALLAVSKQIYHEGRDMLYGNEFHLGDTLALHSFLVDIGPRAAALLKKINLIRWGEGRGVHKAYNHAAFTALMPATNLERFTMHKYYLYRQVAGKAVATQFYRDAFPWLEAMAVAKGRVDAAVEVVDVKRGDYFFEGEKCKSLGDMEAFRKELRRLLGDRMKMIRS